MTITAENRTNEPMRLDSENIEILGAMMEDPWKTIGELPAFSKVRRVLTLTATAARRLTILLTLDIGEGRVIDYRDSSLAILPPEMAGRFNHEPTRRRKLLLKQSEIRKMKRGVEAKGITLVPLRLYFKGSWVKVEIGLAVGKRAYDKRAAIAKRDADREMERARKEAGRR